MTLTKQHKTWLILLGIVVVLYYAGHHDGGRGSLIQGLDTPGKANVTIDYTHSMNTVGPYVSGVRSGSGGLGGVFGLATGTWLRNETTLNSVVFDEVHRVLTNNVSDTTWHIQKMKEAGMNLYYSPADWQAFSAPMFVPNENFTRWGTWKMNDDQGRQLEDWEVFLNTSAINYPLLGWTCAGNNKWHAFKSWNYSVGVPRAAILINSTPNVGTMNYTNAIDYWGQNSGFCKTVGFFPQVGNWYTAEIQIKCNPQGSGDVNPAGCGRLLFQSTAKVGTIDYPSLCNYTAAGNLQDTWQNVTCDFGPVEANGFASGGNLSNMSSFVVECYTGRTCAFTRPRFYTNHNTTPGDFKASGSDEGLPLRGVNSSRSSDLINNTLSTMQNAVANNMTVLWSVEQMPVGLSNTSWECVSNLLTCGPADYAEYARWLKQWAVYASNNGQYASNMMVQILYRPNDGGYNGITQGYFLQNGSVQDYQRRNEYNKLYLVAYDALKSLYGGQIRVGGSISADTGYADPNGLDHEAFFGDWLVASAGKRDFIGIYAIKNGDPGWGVINITNTYARICAERSQASCPWLIYHSFGDASTIASVNISLHTFNPVAGTGVPAYETASQFLYAYLWTLNQNYPAGITIMPYMWSNGFHYPIDGGINVPYVRNNVNTNVTIQDYAIRYAMLEEPRLSGTPGGELFLVYNITRFINSVFPPNSVIYNATVSNGTYGWATPGSVSGGNTYGRLPMAATKNGSRYLVVFANSNQDSNRNISVLVLQPLGVPSGTNALRDVLDEQPLVGPNDTGGRSNALYELSENNTYGPINIPMDRARLMEFIVQSVCTPGDQLCSQDGTSYQTCIGSGQWDVDNPTACTGKVCVQNGASASCQCQGECTPTSQKCSDDHASRVTCGTNTYGCGVWLAGEACPADQSCTMVNTEAQCQSGCTDACVENTEQCDPNPANPRTSWLCTKPGTGCTYWDTTSLPLCVAGFHCEPYLSVTVCAQDPCPTAPCSAGEEKCDGNSRVDCVANAQGCYGWGTPVACTAPATCVLASGSANCLTNYQGCEDACGNTNAKCSVSGNGYVQCVQAPNDCYIWNTTLDTVCNTNSHCANLSGTITCEANATTPPTSPPDEPGLKSSHLCYRCLDNAVTNYEAINTTATCGADPAQNYPLTSAVTCAQDGPGPTGLSPWLYVAAAAIVLIWVIPAVLGRRSRRKRK